jgi:uncharacterized membrane protein
LTRLRWLLRQLSQRLWVRAAIYALVGVASALLSIVAAPLVPADLSARVGADAVDKILGILASSMLTVAIFSLTTMVSAYGAAASSATPRATALLQSDTSAHNALGTFIGAFLFSLAGLIALSTGLYGSSGRLLLFGVTIVVVLIVVTTFIAWIDKLSHLGRMGETIDRVSTAAAEALDAWLVSPDFGAAPARKVPAGARAVVSPVTGYVQFIDIAVLARLCEEHGAEVDVAVLPGAFVGQGDVLCHVTNLPEERAGDAESAFVLGARRSFRQDPRFGLIVLSEIGSRALSPAINDPGTVIDVLAAFARLLRRQPEMEPLPRVAAVHMPPLEPEALLEDSFSPLIRDAVGQLEVELRLQRILMIVAGNPAFASAARAMARDAAERGLATERHSRDRERLAEAAGWMRD